MPPLFFWPIALLVVVALSGVDARAVDTNITSIPTASIPSIPTANASLSAISDLTNTTASSQSCTDINTCRTLNQIVVSCLVTILGCVWFAVHRNVPAPKQPLLYIPNVFARIAQRAWSLVRDQREPAIVVVVALLAPEWILAWALRQAFVARRLVRKLEAASLKAIAARSERHSTDSDSDTDTEEVPGSSDGHASLARSTANQTDDEHIELINRHHNTREAIYKCEKCAARGSPSQCDLFVAAQSIGKADKAWGMSHAFFVAMGGFQFYNKSKALRPLCPEDVRELVERGHLVPPTAEEIANQSKGDILSKGVAVIQTLWFVVQCVVRRAEGLPITSLEVMTLAYTIMTVAMYIAWWDKPLNVACAVRVPEEEVQYSGGRVYDSLWERIFAYVMGMQDHSVDLRGCKHVPTFWAGDTYNDNAGNADVIALFVTMAFGAVHCIAWYSKFQTPLELQLWRSSAITIIAVPVALAVVLAGGFALAQINDNLTTPVVGSLYTLVAIIYIAARLVLITLSFTSLRGLPAGAYQTIQWTTWIPHI